METYSIELIIETISGWRFSELEIELTSLLAKGVLSTFLRVLLSQAVQGSLISTIRAEDQKFPAASETGRQAVILRAQNSNSDLLSPVGMSQCYRTEN